MRSLEFDYIPNDKSATLMVTTKEVSLEQQQQLEIIKTKSPAVMSERPEAQVPDSNSSLRINQQQQSDTVGLEPNTRQQTVDQEVEEENSNNNDFDDDQQANESVQSETRTNKQSETKDDIKGVEGQGQGNGQQVSSGQLSEGAQSLNGTSRELEDEFEDEQDDDQEQDAQLTANDNGAELSRRVFHVGNYKSINKASLADELRKLGSQKANKLFSRSKQLKRRRKRKRSKRKSVLKQTQTRQGSSTTVGYGPLAGDDGLTMSAASVPGVLSNNPISSSIRQHFPTLTNPLQKLFMNKLSPGLGQNQIPYGAKQHRQHWQQQQLPFGSSAQESFESPTSTGVGMFRQHMATTNNNNYLDGSSFSPDLLNNWSSSEDSPAYAQSTKSIQNTGPITTKNKMIPIEIIGLDPAVTDSILFGDNSSPLSDSIETDLNAPSSSNYHQMAHGRGYRATQPKASSVLHIHHFHNQAKQPSEQQQSEKQQQAPSTSQISQSEVNLSQQQQAMDVLQAQQQGEVNHQQQQPAQQQVFVNEKGEMVYLAMDDPNGAQLGSATTNGNQEPSSGASDYGQTSAGPIGLQQSIEDQQDQQQQQQQQQAQLASDTSQQEQVEPPTVVQNSMDQSIGLDNSTQPTDQAESVNQNLQLSNSGSTSRLPIIFNSINQNRSPTLEPQSQAAGQHVFVSNTGQTVTLVNGQRGQLRQQPLNLERDTSNTANPTSDQKLLMVAYKPRLKPYNISYERAPPYNDVQESKDSLVSAAGFGRANMLLRPLLGTNVVGDQSSKRLLQQEAQFGPQSNAQQQDLGGPITLFGLRPPVNVTDLTSRLNNRNKSIYADMEQKGTRFPAQILSQLNRMPSSGLSSSLIGQPIWSLADEPQHKRQQQHMQLNGYDFSKNLNATLLSQTSSPAAIQQLQQQQQNLIENLALLKHLRQVNNRLSQQQLLMTKGQFPGAKVVNLTAVSAKVATTRPGSTNKFELTQASDQSPPKFAAKIFAQDANALRPNGSNSHNISHQQQQSQEAHQRQQRLSLLAANNLGANFQQQPQFKQVNQNQQQLPGSNNDEQTGEFSDSNGPSNFALAFIFIVSLITLTIIAASMIYRQRRRSVGRCADLPARSRLNLTQRTKHFVRSNFVNPNDVASVKSINLDSTCVASAPSGAAASGNQSKTLRGNTFDSDSNSIPSSSSSSSAAATINQHNLTLNPNVPTNDRHAGRGGNAANERCISGKISKLSTFNALGSANLDEKYQINTEDPASADIKTLNTRIQKLSYLKSLISSSQQQSDCLPLGAANATVTGNKTKVSKELPPPPPAESTTYGVSENGSTCYLNVRRCSAINGGLFKPPNLKQQQQQQQIKLQPVSGAKTTSDEHCTRSKSFNQSSEPKKSYRSSSKIDSSEKYSHSGQQEGFKSGRMSTIQSIAGSDKSPTSQSKLKHGNNKHSNIVNQPKHQITGNLTATHHHHTHITSYGHGKERIRAPDLFTQIDRL